MPKKTTETWIATGRRKSSVARVRFTKGKGNIVVNKRPLEEYFGRDTAKMVLKQPLDLVGIGNQYDISVNVNGGGLSGQAGAIILGIARAIVKFEPELKSPLKKNKLTTRDSRVVERKKYGHKKARKSFQFSKR